MQVPDVQSSEIGCKRQHLWSPTGREIIGPDFSSLPGSARDKERLDKNHTTHDDSLVSTSGGRARLVTLQLPMVGEKAREGSSREEKRMT
jgi:hypothetical protein